MVKQMQSKRSDIVLIDVLFFLQSLRYVRRDCNIAIRGSVRYVLAHGPSHAPGYPMRPYIEPVL